MDNKKSNKGIIVFLVILLIIVFLWATALTIFVVKMYSDNKIVTDNKTNKEVIKNDKKETSTNIVTEQNKIPYINIDSKDASRINEKIEESYDKIKEGYYLNSNYNYYENNDIVSIVIRFMQEGANKDYVIYNINKDTGYEVTNKELLDYKNMTLSSLKSKMKSIFLEKVKTSEGYSMRIASDDFTSVEQATNLNIERYSLDTAQMYLNQNNDLCVVIEEYQIAGAETGNYIMNIDKLEYEK